MTQLEQEWEELKQRVDAGLNPAIDARLAELQFIESSNQVSDLSSAILTAQLSLAEAIAVDVSLFQRS